MIWAWIGFISLVLGMLALDLGVFHRKAHIVKMKEALGWSAIWISLGLLFTIFVYFGYDRHWLGLGMSKDGITPLDQLAVTADNPLGQLDGTSASIKYLTGYVVEKSLSVDNIFVIAMIFAFFAVPAIYQHRVLFWGILGALLMRAVMILVGAALITRFQWILYVFAGILFLTAIKMLLIKQGDPDPSKNILVRFAKRLIPTTDRYHGEHFFVRAGSDASHAAPIPGSAIEKDPAVEAMEQAGKTIWMMTPLFLALIMVEFTDLIFAVDSIPAIFGITTDPFLVFTSNVFAILGLRSLYFALSQMIDKFRYLKVSLALVLMVVALKMFFHNALKNALGAYAFNFYVLGIIMLILLVGIVASILANKRAEAVSSPA